MRSPQPMSIWRAAAFAPPQHGVGLSPPWGPSPLARMDAASLPGRESSAAWAHACHAGWSRGGEEPWPLFWVTREVLRGTKLIVWP